MPALIVAPAPLPEAAGTPVTEAGWRHPRTAPSLREVIGTHQGAAGQLLVLSRVSLSGQLNLQNNPTDSPPVCGPFIRY